MEHRSHDLRGLGVEPIGDGLPDLEQLLRAPAGRQRAALAALTPAQRDQLRIDNDAAIDLLQRRERVHETAELERRQRLGLRLARTTPGSGSTLRYEQTPNATVRMAGLGRDHRGAEGSDQRGRGPQERRADAALEEHIERVRAGAEHEGALRIYLDPRCEQAERASALHRLDGMDSGARDRATLLRALPVVGRGRGMRLEHEAAAAELARLAAADPTHPIVAMHRGGKVDITGRDRYGASITIHGATIDTVDAGVAGGLRVGITYPTRHHLPYADRWISEPQHDVVGLPTPGAAVTPITDPDQDPADDGHAAGGELAEARGDESPKAASPRRNTQPASAARGRAPRPRSERPGGRGGHNGGRRRDRRPVDDHDTIAALDRPARLGGSAEEVARALPDDELHRLRALPAVAGSPTPARRVIDDEWSRRLGEERDDLYCSLEAFAARDRLYEEQLALERRLHRDHGAQAGRRSDAAKRRDRERRFEIDRERRSWNDRGRRAAWLAREAERQQQPPGPPGR